MSEFDEQLLIEQSKLGYEELKTAKDEFNKYALAGFSGFLIFSGWLVANSKIFTPVEMKVNPFIITILLIVPLIGSIFLMVSQVILGRYAIAQWWLTFRLTELAPDSKLLKDKKSFFQIFNSNNPEWHRTPLQIKWSEIATTFVYWATIISTSAVCYGLYIHLARKYKIFHEPLILGALIVSAIVFLFSNGWTVWSVIFYFRKSFMFRDKFINTDEQKA